MNCYSLKLGLDEENHQLSKKEMEKREDLHIKREDLLIIYLHTNLTV